MKRYKHRRACKVACPASNNCSPSVLSWHMHNARTEASCSLPMPAARAQARRLEKERRIPSARNEQGHGSAPIKRRDRRQQGKVTARSTPRATGRQPMTAPRTKASNYECGVYPPLCPTPRSLSSEPRTTVDTFR